MVGFQPSTSERTFAWGSTDVRIVLTPLASVDLRVTDGARPVEGYSVHLAKAPKSDVRIHLDYPLVGCPGPHPNGIVRVAGPLRGNFLLKVLPDDPALAESPFVPVRFDVEPAPPLEIALPAAATQALRVVLVGLADPETVPVPGARVQLLEPIGDAPIHPTTGTFRRVSWVSGEQAYEWMSGATDVHGSCRLRGPVGVPLTIRVSGRGFATLVRRDVRLTPRGDPIVVRVLKGATVTGTLRPPELVRQLHELAAGSSRLRPGLVLARDGETVPRNASEPAAFAADGSFTIEDVPPGTWELRLWTVRTRGGYTAAQWETVATVRDIASGEVRRIELDRSTRLFARIRGTLFTDGEPTARGRLELRGAGSVVYLDADTAGRFGGLVPPGRYALRIGGVPSGAPLWIPADETVVLTAGEARAVDVHGHTRQVVLRVVDGRGTAVPGVHLSASESDGKNGNDLPRTDAAGVCTVRLPLGKLAVWAAPRDGGRTKRVRVQEIELSGGEGPFAVRIEIPAGLGY